ncbi:MAG: SHOCT domain-containing protein [Solirubrobacterales bacterium]
MGLFDLLRRKDESAIPEPGTPEFEAAVAGSAIPDGASVEMGQSGWASTGSAADDALRRHGIDPDKPDQRVDASSVPGLQEAIFGALGDAGIQIPGAGGFGGGVSAPQQDPLAAVEHLARKRDAGEITDAELEAQKKRLLGS